MSRRVAEEHAPPRAGLYTPRQCWESRFARARKIFVLAAGARVPLERIRPLLERLGQRLLRDWRRRRIGEPRQARGKRPHRDNPSNCMGEVLALLQKGGIEGHLAFEVPDQLAVRLGGPQDLRGEDCREAIQPPG